MSAKGNSSEQNGDNTYQDYFNFAFIGDQGVGKTAIAERFCNEKFATEKKKKKPIDLFQTTMVLNQVEYSFKFWDTEYNENPLKQNKSIYQRADCIVLVCAINDKGSFDSIDTWLKALSDNIDISTKQILLLGNKADLEDERQVGVDELRQKAEELEITFYETSARNNVNIKEAFQAVIEKVVSKVYKEETTELKADEINTSSKACVG